MTPASFQVDLSTELFPIAIFRADEAHEQLEQSPPPATQPMGPAPAPLRGKEVMVVGMFGAATGLRELAKALGAKEAPSVSEHTIVVSNLEYLTKEKKSKIAEKILKSTVSKHPVANHSEPGATDPAFHSCSPLAVL